MAGPLPSHNIAGMLEVKQELNAEPVTAKQGCCLDRRGCVQVNTPWRKACDKLEGDEVFEALDKIDRLEVWQDHIKCALIPELPLCCIFVRDGPLTPRAHDIALHWCL